MPAPTLQDGIDQAGSPIRLLWKPGAPPPKVPVVQPEYVGWREEQAAWRQGVALSDLSHHMSDLFLEGPDATRLLAAISANDYESFEIGQAKQFIPVTDEGYIVTDGILMREAPQRYVLSGVPAAQSWVLYHAQKGGYAVSVSIDPDSSTRTSGDPVLFRYQIQGPRVPELLERAFGEPIPKMKLFHSVPVLLAGRSFRAFRHGIAGQIGYEFIGPWRDGPAVKEALMSAGKSVGMVHVGGLAHATNGIESGWVPTPTPGIYTAPELADYRRFLSLRSFEGEKPLHGTFFSENIEDYYVSPYELGYGKSIVFNHEFIGRKALERAKSRPMRTKVTLVLNIDDVRDIFGANPGYVLSYARYRIESATAMAGMTFYSAWIDPIGTILSLALIDPRYAPSGTEVAVVWGEHPGAAGVQDTDLRFARIRATVRSSPYDEFVRTQYRQSI